MAEVGAPFDHELFEIETAGTVLVSCVIRMCVTPSHLRTPVCIAPDRRNGWVRFHW
jgi:hypothetical protein